MSKDQGHENILQETLQQVQEQQQPRQEEEAEGGLAAREAVKEKEECKTPTASDQKIPTIRSCPPTPKKKARPSFMLKRKRSDLQFFETTRRDEVESFFRSNSESFTFCGGSSGFKRRCRSA